jgi:hypothetical protein
LLGGCIELSSSFGYGGNVTRAQRALERAHCRKQGLARNLVQSVAAGMKVVDELLPSQEVALTDHLPL